MLISYKTLHDALMPYLNIYRLILLLGIILALTLIEAKFHIRKNIKNKCNPKIYSISALVLFFIINLAIKFIIQDLDQLYNIVIVLTALFLFFGF